MLTKAEQGDLLTLARETLARYLADASVPRSEPCSDALRQRRGVFVTLWHGDDLRGCIGSITDTRPLHLAVQRAAVLAATEDPRFFPVTRDELDALRIEISILGPLEPVEDVDDIEVGVHGLLIRSGLHQGLLLPQVAPAAGWDRDALLQGVCAKAGLPCDAWQTAELFRFTGEVFEEVGT